jgi:hypothetical protein
MQNKRLDISLHNKNVTLEYVIDKAVLLIPSAELSLIAESFCLLNDLLPFLSILDACCPIFYLHLANILFDVILPSVLGSSLYLLVRGFQLNILTVLVSDILRI